MFHSPPYTRNHVPRYIYLHKLEKIFNDRPLALASNLSIPFRRRLFLLKRWRDERILYMFESCRDHDYEHDMTLCRLNLSINHLKRMREKARILRRTHSVKERKAKSRV